MSQTWRQTPSDGQYHNYTWNAFAGERLSEQQWVSEEGNACQLRTATGVVQFYSGAWLRDNVNSGGGSQPGLLETNWKDIAFMANDLTQAYIGANTTIKASAGYRLAQTTVQLPLGLATRTSTTVLSVVSKVGGGIAKAAPWAARGAIVVDVVSNKQITAGNVYQGVITGLSLIAGAGLIVGGSALALEGISYYYTGKSVSDNIDQSLDGGIVHSWQ